MQIKQLDSYDRQLFTVPTRRLLCHFAAGDLWRPLPIVDADWEEVFQGVCSNGLLGLTWRYLAQQQERDYPPATFRQQVQTAYRLSVMRMVGMYRKLLPLLTELTRGGIDVLVVKGPAVAYTIYPDPDLRSFNDLDLLVRERDWAAMHQQLLELGFSAEADLPHPPPKLIPQSVPYEMKYRHRESGLLVEVHYDDILNAGLAARDVAGFWRRATWINVENISVKVMALEDQLIHLCMHAHYHGYTRLNWFADIAFIVRDRADELDWEQVIATTRTEQAQVGVYYSLVLLEQVVGVAAPAEVVRALLPDRLRRWLHERYMPAQKIRSLEPMWRPDFSFYFRPLFKRLLPDLLVMGRRGEKLVYLGRLLLPPRAWLRYYYHLDPTRPVGIHYLLHPLKLGYHYLMELREMLM